MHIGVSAWRLCGQRLGIGRYIEHLLKQWNTMLKPEDRVTVFVNEPDHLLAELVSGQFAFETVRPKLTNALWENLLLPRHTNGTDVLFGPSYTLPLRYGGKSVVAIHSVDEAEPGAQPWWYHYTYSQKYRLSAKRASRVVTNAQSTKERICSHYGVADDKVDVIWLGVDDAFQRLDDPELARATRLRYLGVDRPYVLFAGGLSRRRNIPILMAAFATVQRDLELPHHLLLLGPNRAGIPVERLAEDLGIADRVVQTDGMFSRHQEIVAAYNAADLYVLPSASEGFSLTLAEAMACGLPVITVNRAALGEVGNGYGHMIDEPTVSKLTEAMYQILSNQQYAEELRSRSLLRAQSLRWDATARRTLDVLRRVANGEEGAP